MNTCHFRSGMDLQSRPGSKALPEIMKVRFMPEQDSLGCWRWRQRELGVEVVQLCAPCTAEGAAGRGPGIPEGCTACSLSGGLCVRARLCTPVCVSCMCDGVPVVCACGLCACDVHVWVLGTCALLRTPVFCCRRDARRLHCPWTRAEEFFISVALRGD